MKTLITTDDPWTVRIINQNKGLLNELGFEHEIDPNLSAAKDGIYDSSLRNKMILVKENNRKEVFLKGDAMTDENNLKKILAA